MIETDALNISAPLQFNISYSEIIPLSASAAQLGSGIAALPLGGEGSESNRYSRPLDENNGRMPLDTPTPLLATPSGDIYFTDSQGGHCLFSFAHDGQIYIDLINNANASQETCITVSMWPRQQCLHSTSARRAAAVQVVSGDAGSPFEHPPSIRFIH